MNKQRTLQAVCMALLYLLAPLCIAGELLGNSFLIMPPELHGMMIGIIILLLVIGYMTGWIIAGDTFNPKRIFILITFLVLIFVIAGIVFALKHLLTALIHSSGEGLAGAALLLILVPIAGAFIFMTTMPLILALLPVSTRRKIIPLLTLILIAVFSLQMTGFIHPLL